MKTKFYPVHYRLNKKNRYLILEIDDENEDTFYIDKKLIKIPVFTELKFLKQYAKKRDIKVVKDSEPIVHNLDIVLKWIKKNAKGKIECTDILTVWNFFIDMANTFELDNDELQAYRSKAVKAYKVYEKVFIGTNLPSVTQNNPPYHPKFNSKELKLIQRVLTYGYKKFKKKRIKIK
ncbi:MAG: hypothetical protein C0625_13635 [Arcobacter sp.]|nr:MAG: hypothetical protein C0625_13635 [Arcobacter sp.]